jgi:hypothetical protein
VAKKVRIKTLWSGRCNQSIRAKLFPSRVEAEKSGAFSPPNLAGAKAAGRKEKEIMIIMAIKILMYLMAL